MLVHDFLSRSAQRRPEAIAVFHDGQQATYGEIERGASRIAWALIDAGVQSGDRVLLVAPNSSFYVEAYFGILKAGGVVVALNAASDSHTIGNAARDCQAVALVSGDRQADAVGGATASLPDLRALLAPRAGLPDALPAHVVSIPLEDLPARSTAPDVRRIDLDHASIVYTSGSTGRPRGAVLTHLNLVSNTRSIVTYLGLSSDDRMLVILPFHYVYGASLLNTHTYVGGSLIIENRFLFPQTALDTLDRESATGLAGVPSTFAILLNRTNFERRRMPSLRYVTQAGGAMAPSLIRRLAASLEGRRVYIMYGATEASARLSYLDPADLDRKVGSIGKAIPNVEMKVLRSDGTEAAPGEVGEIVARGSNIMQGYWGDPDETMRVLDRRGFHTGDLGYVDDEGFFWVVGRAREMIKSGAHRIHPKEIEDVLLEHPDVHEVAVLGTPDEVLGEALRALVVFRKESSSGPLELAEFCRKRLPPFKVPRNIEARAELPKNAAGKIDRERLRREAAEDLG